MLARAAPLWLAALTLGCVAEPVPQDHYYRLASIPHVGARPGAPALDGVVVVERFTAEGLTRGRAIVYSQNGKDLEVRRHLYHHWTDPPAELVRAELVTTLRAARFARRVVTPELRVRADYEITGRIQRFERVLEGRRVHARMVLSLRDLHSGELVWSGIYDRETPVEGDRVVDAAAGFSTLVDGIVRQFMTDALAQRTAASCAPGVLCGRVLRPSRGDVELQELLGDVMPMPESTRHHEARPGAHRRVHRAIVGHHGDLHLALEDME